MSLPEPSRPMVGDGNQEDATPKRGSWRRSTGFTKGSISARKRDEEEDERKRKEKFK